MMESCSHCMSNHEELPQQPCTQVFFCFDCRRLYFLRKASDGLHLTQVSNPASGQSIAKLGVKTMSESPSFKCLRYFLSGINSAVQVLPKGQAWNKERDYSKLTSEHRSGYGSMIF